MSDVGLISGGAGGYVNLSNPSSAESGSEPVTETTAGETNNITFSPSTPTSSILETGFFALVGIFVVREFFSKK